MRYELLARLGWLRAQAGRRVRAGCIALCLAALGLSVSAQTLQRETTMKSGSYSVAPGHKFGVSFTEVGDAAASSFVRVEIRDAADNLVAQLPTTTLTTRTPVAFQVTAPNDGRMRRWRVVAIINTSTAANLTSPMTVVEDTDPARQTVNVLAQAGSPPKPPTGPIPNDGAKMSCPDFEYFVTTL